MKSALTARQVIDKAMTEKAFQEMVIDLFQTRKWQVFHVYDSRRSTHGWPDIVAVRAPRLIFAELKIDSARSKTTAAQDWWLENLAMVAAANNTLEVYEWRPSEYESIMEVAA